LEEGGLWYTMERTEVHIPNLDSCEKRTRETKAMRVSTELDRLGG
jgi:hypothetical protein